MNDDTRLGTLLSRDDVPAFDAIYYKYYRAVYANIFKLVRHPQTAEDILQDVFTALWINRKKIDGHQSIAGWLFVVSHNKALKFLDRAIKEKLHTRQANAFHSAEDNLEIEAHQSSIIDKAIARLPPQKKLVFTLCKLEGKTYEEAAQLAGISSHTVKEYVSAASKFVKAYSLREYAIHTPLSLSLFLTVLHHL